MHIEAGSFIKLDVHGNPLSEATSYTVDVALSAPGFPCPFAGKMIFRAGPDLNSQPPPRARGGDGWRTLAAINSKS